MDPAGGSFDRNERIFEHKPGRSRTIVISRTLVRGLTIARNGTVAASFKNEIYLVSRK